MEIKIYQYPLSNNLAKDVERLLDKSFGLLSSATPEHIAESKNTHYSAPVEYILAFDGENLLVVCAWKKIIVVRG